MSSSCIPFTDVTDKTLEECNLLWKGCAVEKGVQVVEFPAEVLPVRPISQADFLGLSQDPTGGVSPRSTVKTREAIVVCRRSMSHELSCGRGKSELKRAKKAASERA
jgi:hypothetical protein